MKDWHDILQTCELHNWKEALAAVMTYARPEEFSSLCGRLKVIGGSSCSPFVFKSTLIHECVWRLWVFQIFSGADWKQQKTSSCEPRPACVTSAQET